MNPTPSPLRAAVECRVPRAAPDAAERLRLRAIAAALPDTLAGHLAAAFVAARLDAAPPPLRAFRPVYGPGPVPAVPVVYAVRVAPSTTLRGEATR